MTLEMNTITIYFMYIKKIIFNVAKKSRQRSVREWKLKYHDHVRESSIAFLPAT